MKIALRADASETQGTGHVMRCLTLAEAFIDHGHSVTFVGSLGNIPWLRKIFHDTGLDHVKSEPDLLDIDLMLASGFDGIAIDSYQIPADQISDLNTRVPCLAIIDGDARGIVASLYLDQNLGASLKGIPSGHESSWLGGSDFALVRDAVLEQRRAPSSTELHERAHVVAFMGGSDPGGAIVNVAQSIVVQGVDANLTLISPRRWLPQVEAIVADHDGAKVIEPTIDLPRVMGDADIVVSASGTSAWDILTMARPAVLVAVVENQQASLTSIEREGVALTIDASPTGNGSLKEVGAAVASLVNSPRLRQQLANRSSSIFDGKGKDRVVEEIEKTWT